MAITGLEEVRQMPGFTTILKAVLKSQIQHLVDQLARETQEESLVVATCLEDGTISHLGSELGKDFLEDSADMKSSFLGFCLKRKYRQMSSKDQGPNRSSESADSYVSSPMLELDYTSAQTSSPHPVTLCQVSSFRQGVVQLKQQELSHHGQQNSPGKIRISGKHRHEPYKGKGEQKNKTGSRQEQHKGGSTVQSEDLAVDYINASNNSSSLGEGDGNVSIKIEPLDESDKQLQEETAVDSDTRFPAHLSKGASTDPISGDTNSSPTNKVQTGDATKTIPYPSSVGMCSPSQESFNMENQFSEVIVKIETSVDMYDQEEETSSCSLDLAETKYEKMEQSTCEIQSGKEKGIKETGTKPEECLFSEKKKLEELKEKTENVSDGHAGEMKDYTPKKGIKIPKADYIVSDSPCPGYILFGGQGSRVHVSVKWSATMTAKTRNMTPSMALKKYMDGFLAPWELQSVSSSSISVLTGDRREIFDGLRLFASNHLKMSEQEFKKAVNTKAGACRRTMHNISPDTAIPKRKKGFPLSHIEVKSQIQE